jgi:hypothetical protein
MVWKKVFSFFFFRKFRYDRSDWYMPPTHHQILTAQIEHASRTSELKRVERDGYLWQDVTIPQKSVKLGLRSLATFQGGLMLQPTFSCPLDLVKTQSVRQAYDGGKWLCGLSFLGGGGSRSRISSSPGAADPAPPCLLYSIGSNFEDSFEQYVMGKTQPHPCETHIYDPTLTMVNDTEHGRQKLQRFRADASARGWFLHDDVALAATDGARSVTLKSARHNSRNIGGGNRSKAQHGGKRAAGGGPRQVSFPAYSLREMVRWNRHEGRCIDILKIDVEGLEGEVLPSTNWSQLCVGMLLVELHSALIDLKEIAAKRGPYNIKRALESVQRLERAGFAHYSTEIVCPSCVGQMEVAFVNVSWLQHLVRRGGSRGEVLGRVPHE